MVLFVLSLGNSIICSGLFDINATSDILISASNFKYHRVDIKLFFFGDLICNGISSFERLKLWYCVSGRVKQKTGFIKRVDRGRITTVNDLKS